MRRRLGRPLTGEEIQLWSHVARTVRPFSGRSLPAPPQAGAEPEIAPALPGEALLPSSRQAGPASPPKPALAPLVPLERRTLTALRRGTQSLEAVLDLHGLRQSQAHDRLRGFLMQEQQRGARLVLVITGKGAAGMAMAGDERGVLKRMVPHWLRMADLRPVVLGFEDAAHQHGGAGAIYVRLRRLKDHGP
ncbi:MAG: Smr/MutS family protein [Hyphomicrobiales bacterium]|nr:Smr/MutS family protein [Hyphomicrobiales bacterium]